MQDVQAEAADLPRTRVEHGQGGTFIHTTATWLPSTRIHVGTSISTAIVALLNNFHVSMVG